MIQRDTTSIVLMKGQELISKSSMSGGNNFHQRIGGANLEENKILIHFTEPNK